MTNAPGEFVGSVSSWVSPPCSGRLVSVFTRQSCGYSVRGQKRGRNFASSQYGRINALSIESTGDTTFARNLREIRELRKLSQSDLAQKIGVQPGHISHFETGRRAPSLLILKKLADALQTSMDYLTGRVDDPDQKSQPNFGNSVVAQINRTVKELNSDNQEIAQIMIEALRDKEKKLK